MWAALRRLSSLDGKSAVLSVGQSIEATWSDGLVLSGRYYGTERGYVILLTEDGKQIVCNPTVVTFRKLDEKR